MFIFLESLFETINTKEILHESVMMYYEIRAKFFIINILEVICLPLEDTLHKKRVLELKETEDLKISLCLCKPVEAIFFMISTCT
jgi:hypothetical protein